VLGFLIGILRILWIARIKISVVVLSNQIHGSLRRTVIIAQLPDLFSRECYRTCRLYPQGVFPVEFPVKFSGGRPGCFMTPVLELPRTEVFGGWLWSRSATGHGEPMGLYLGVQELGLLVAIPSGYDWQFAMVKPWPIEIDDFPS